MCWGIIVLRAKNWELKLLPLRSSRKIIEVWLKNRAIWVPHEEYISFWSLEKGSQSILNRLTCKRANRFPIDSHRRNPNRFPIDSPCKSCQIYQPDYRCVYRTTGGTPELGKRLRYMDRTTGWSTGLPVEVQWAWKTNRKTTGLPVRDTGLPVKVQKTWKLCGKGTGLPVKATGLPVDGRDVYH